MRKTKIKYVFGKRIEITYPYSFKFGASIQVDGDTLQNYLGLKLFFIIIYFPIPKIFKKCSTDMCDIYGFSINKFDIHFNWGVHYKIFETPLAKYYQFIKQPYL